MFPRFTKHFNAGGWNPRGITGSRVEHRCVSHPRIFEALHCLPLIVFNPVCRVILFLLHGWQWQSVRLVLRWTGRPHKVVDVIQVPCFLERCHAVGWQS
eukprot:12401168-Karenia_brevis.AAC.1